MQPRTLFDNIQSGPSSPRRGSVHGSMNMNASTRTPRTPRTPGRSTKPGRAWNTPSLVSVLGSTPTGSRERKKPVNMGMGHVPVPFDLRMNMNASRPNPTTPSQEIKRRPSTNGRSLSRSSSYSSSSPSRSYRFHGKSTEKRGRTTSNPASCDRFIPNRSQMKIDICSASIFSADKNRMKAIDKKLSERSLGANESTTNEANSPSNGTSSTSEILTPIQSEYRARLRGTLLNLSSDYANGMGMRQTPTRTMNRANEQNSSNVGFNRITPNFLGQHGNDEMNNLVYSNISGDDENDINGSENIDPSGRMLSFQGNSFDASNTSGVPGNFTHNPVTPDPYTHDQLHVFDRNYSVSALIDPVLENSSRNSSTKTNRKINAAPTRILDAPELVDDYYLNLISWGKDNILAVALGQCVYLWNATSGDIQHLLTLPGEEDFVTSVRWADLPGHSNYLAIGTNDGPVQLWDTDGMKKVRTMRGHAARVGSLSWNKNLLSSGGRDSIIIQHDVRSANHIVSTYAGHTQEVCGLEWNEDGTTLASGGNENYLCIWDAAMSMRASTNGRNMSNRDSPRLLLTQHQAAVKALAWCPFHRGLLASGGGTADRTIKFWNSNSGALLNSIDTGSQVCSLLWSKHQRELCSSHGFSENQLILWRYPTMTKIQEFKGHTARVLHMEQSPDGASVVSAAADETLRFWDVFGSPPSESNRDTFSMGGFSGRATILR